MKVAPTKKKAPTDRDLKQSSYFHRHKNGGKQAGRMSRQCFCFAGSVALLIHAHSCLTARACVAQAISTTLIHKTLCMLCNRNRIVSTYMCLTFTYIEFTYYVRCLIFYSRHVLATLHGDCLTRNCIIETMLPAVRHFSIEGEA